MKDPVEASQLFAASSRLQSAATALRKMSQGKQMSPQDRSTLKWSGRFLEEVDWESKKGRDGVCSEFAVQATEVRPSFYSTMLNIQPAFRAAGITDMAERSHFFASIYELLATGGRPAPKHALPSNQLALAADFLEQLALSLLVLLNDTRRPDPEFSEPLLSCYV